MLIQTELVGNQTLEGGSQDAAGLWSLRHSTSKEVNVIRISKIQTIRCVLFENFKKKKSLDILKVFTYILVEVPVQPGVYD